MNEIFLSIGTIIIIGTAFAYIAKIMKQPLIPAYVLTGLLLGPILGIITNTSVISTMSEIGIAFLLFIVGLEIDTKKLSTVGKIATIGGFIQVFATFCIAFVASLMLGFSSIESAYIGIIVAFSSTMVVVKFLSDKKEVDTLHGRIMIGILLMQDIIAIIALSILTNINNSIAPILISFGKGIILIGAAIICSKYIFPFLFKFAAKNYEILFLLSTSVCLLFAIAANYLDFSMVIGAFLAGVSLANLPYTVEIIGKVKSLRDFFATIFFVSLGMELALTTVKAIIFPLIIITLITIIIKPIIIMFICSFFGYKKRVGFMTAISLAQISEFSLIIVAQGMLLGHVTNELFTLTVMLGIITITATSYFVDFEDILYEKMKNLLKPFDRFARKDGTELEYLPEKKKGHVVLCGCNRVGHSIIRTLNKLKKPVIIVDFNPSIVGKLIKEKVPSIYGDIGDSEVLDRLNLKHASMVISTAPTKQDNILLIRRAKEANKRVIVFVTANVVEDALDLYSEGADYVILPHFLGGEHASVLIEELKGNVNKMIKTKLDHIEELKHRKEIGHEHPES